MPKVDSSGKIGTSMDYSMYLKHKRHDILTSGYTLKSAAGNPMFGRDKKTRGFDNGIVTVLFENGLTVGNRNGGTSGEADLTITFTATTNGAYIEDSNYANVGQFTDYIQILINAADFASTGDGSYPNDYSLERPIEVTLTASTGFSGNGPVTEIFIFTGNKTNDEAENARYVAYKKLASSQFFAIPTDIGVIRYRQL